MWIEVDADKRPQFRSRAGIKLVVEEYWLYYRKTKEKAARMRELVLAVGGPRSPGKSLGFPPYSFSPEAR